MEDAPEIVERNTEIEALVREVHTTFENYVKLKKKIPPEMVMSVSSIDDPGRLADTIVAHLGIKLEDRQNLLETFDAAERLEKVLGHMRAEIEILEVERRIRSRVKKQMERSQKEYYLNEQMRAIQKELGEKDEFKNEIQEIEEKLKQKKLSAEAKDKVEKELKKLKMMSPMSAEATVVRNYIDWIISLPWNEFTDDKFDINEAEASSRRGPFRFGESKRTDSRISGCSESWLEKSKARFSAWSALRAWVRLRWAGPSRAPLAENSSEFRSAEYAMKRKFVGIAGPI